MVNGVSGPLSYLECLESRHKPKPLASDGLARPGGRSLVSVQVSTDSPLEAVRRGEDPLPIDQGASAEVEAPVEADLPGPGPGRCICSPHDLGVEGGRPTH